MKTNFGEVEFIESVLCRSIDDTIVWKNLKFYDKCGKTYKIKKLIKPACISYAESIAGRNETKQSTAKKKRYLGMGYFFVCDIIL